MAFWGRTAFKKMKVSLLNYLAKGASRKCPHSAMSVEGLEAEKKQQFLASRLNRPNVKITE